MEHDLASPCCHQTRSDTGSNTETAARLCNAEGKVARMCSRQRVRWRPWRGLHSQRDKQHHKRPGSTPSIGSEKFISS